MLPGMRLRKLVRLQGSLRYHDPPLQLKPRFQSDGVSFVVIFQRPTRATAAPGTQPLRSLLTLPPGSWKQAEIGPLDLNEVASSNRPLV
jgi:hypothetical protein